MNPTAEHFPALCEQEGLGVTYLTWEGLSKIHKDADRRHWYLGAEADDERVDAALETVR